MFLNPEEIIKELNLDEGMIVADFGCGAGFYSIPAARLVGSSGRVYALDVRREALDVVRSQSRQARLLNIETIRANLEELHGSSIKDQAVDRVIISNILFQVDQKTELIAEAYRILKPRGLVMVVEWEKGAGISVPPSANLVSKETAAELFISSGFTTEKEFSAGSHHYGLIFRKP